MVNAIPEGSRTVTPHLIVRGATKAIDFYVRAFGATDLLRMKGPDGSIAHAEIQIGDSRVYLADENPAWGALSPQSLKGSPVTIHLYVPDVDAWFDRAVKAGAKVAMPVMDQFWGDRYGKLEDPFGHQWSVATHTEDMSPEEMERRGVAAMAEMAKAGPPPQPRAKKPAATRKTAAKKAAAKKKAAPKARAAARRPPAKKKARRR